MECLSFLPTRCLSCARPGSAPLCRHCLARFQPAPNPEAGLGRCPVCDQVRLAEVELCVDCGAQTWSFPLAEGLFGYNDPAGELLRLFKFGGNKRLVELWVRAAQARLVPQGPLVPVPALASRVWRRGWDPVKTLIQGLSRQAGLPVWKVLDRRPSAVQKTLDRAGRLTNAQSSYALAHPIPAKLAGTPLVWLIDDVVTTGATVEACARLLRQAGVREVRVFCLGLH